MRMSSCQVAVIGAGPYGLAAAAHLRSAKVETWVFGDSMEFWRKRMPAGMFLRSGWQASYISAPDNAFTLDEYQAAQSVRLSVPVPLEDFVRYGQWFQQRVVPDLDKRRVLRIERASRGFRLHLQDGDAVETERVVIAAGIGSFAYVPRAFEELPQSLASHSSDHTNLKCFTGRRVLVVGGGQSAIESAALMHEAGADVEIVVRAEHVQWLRGHTWWKNKHNPLKRLMYVTPPTDVGPPVLNHIVSRPDLFRLLPPKLQERVAARSIRPAGARWLVQRVGGMRITTGRTVVSAKAKGNGLSITLDDSSTRSVDHILMGTGYRVDIARYGFLHSDIAASLHCFDGYPRLVAGFESSVPGLHFMGAPAAWSFGPLMRFVSGTSYSARALARAVLVANSGHRYKEKRAWITMASPSQNG